MKKKILLLIIFTLFFKITSAYEPSQDDIKSINTIKEKLWDISSLKWEKWFLERISRFEKIIPKFEKNERYNYALTSVLDEMKIIVNTYWNTQNSVSNDIIQDDYKTFAKAFFNNYWNEITTSLEVDERCKKYFDFVDEIARENNFPTELIIATWWIESNCNLYNPWNWRWPFQIIWDWQEPWDITLDEFKEDVNHFIRFSKNKWKYFNTNTYVNYKERFWSENINITYDNYTMREIKLHWVLFNWVSSDTTLDFNTFVNNNLYPERQWNYDWLATRFLKILNWRVNNK